MKITVFLIYGFKINRLDLNNNIHKYLNLRLIAQREKTVFPNSQYKINRL